MQTRNHNMQTDSCDNGPDPQKVSKLLSKSALGTLVEKAYFLMSLQEALHFCLPEGIRKGDCRVLNWHDNILVIDTPQAHFATRLRYQQEEILEKLNARLGNIEVRALQVKVRP